MHPILCGHQFIGKNLQFCVEHGWVVWHNVYVCIDKPEVFRGWEYLILNRKKKLEQGECKARKYCDVLP